MFDSLHSAAQDGDIGLVQSLLKAGAKPNDFDELGKTPLHYAAAGEHLMVVEALLDAGADVNAHDERMIGNTPLGEVAGNCSLALAELLISRGADPTIPGWMQLNALHRAEPRKRGDGPAVYALLLKKTRRR